MKSLVGVLSVLILMMGISSCSSKRKGSPRVLVFAKSVAWYHKSIPNGLAAFQKLGQENGFIVDTTTNSAYFNEDSLKNYSAVVFLNNTGDVLNHYQQAAFERYIQAGGGYMGIHAAADTEYSWPWYGKLVGAYFKSHPKEQPAKIIVQDKTHISTKHLGDTWELTNEWYNFRVPPSDSAVHVLLTIDEKSYEGGENGDYHPMAWYHDFDGGRSFYTALGHTEDIYADPKYVQHILGGIQYAIGGNKNLDYSKATTQFPPDEDRFTKTILTTGFDEPTEMTILPNLDILVVQRKGEIMLVEHATNKLTQIAKLNVYHKATVPGVNAEEGVLGLSADPDYAKNNFVYIFYSPIDTSVNRLSRFTYSNGKFDLASEKVILQFYSQRNICCHTGGSIAFGPDGSLYVSAGDNSTPFDQPATSTYKLHGYAPLDNRPGFEQWDARRSSGNTNDLRGKIMRIKIKEDGTYTIPEGNLFKPGTPGTKPEIYVMGNRNPYRISIDRKTGFLYWGEVGPDAANDSLETHGPRGYDELNQAREAGYFGWPLFVGKNYPYRGLDYATGAVGAPFDPAKPVNESRNNTGLKELPAVSKPFIWYPYAVSPEFPELGTGGRNAMAGPVYYPEFYPKETRFPDYYHGKLFFYDWIRGWIKAVTMNAQGDFEKMEPFMQGTKFNSPIDMETGPDGKLYILEYGTGWFTKNADAGISRIDYNPGNRSPKASISIDKLTGALPMAVNVSAEGSGDPDKDPVTYVWHFGKEIRETKEAKTNFIFDKAGDYEIYVEVKDDKGAVTRSETKAVYAGNETPEVSIELPNNPGFFFPGQPVKYKVLVNDKEDGTTVDKANIYVKVDYVSGPDKAQVVGHQIVSSLLEGKALFENSDCKTCHKVGEKSIGPSLTAVADKYADDRRANEYLVSKVIKGGGGVWGETAMAAHPDLKPADAQKIVSWIMSLHASSSAKTLAPEGTITPTENDVSGGKAMQISATYTDRGGPGIKSLTGGNVAIINSPVLSPGDNTKLDGVNVMGFGGRKFAIISGTSGVIEFGNVNLTGIKAIEINYASQSPLTKGYIVEAYEGSVDGKKIGEVAIANTGAGQGGKAVIKAAGPLTGRGIVFRIRKADPAETVVMAVTGIRLS
jgi:glucose/arabinose dehydrogenase/cytochrome c551/c552